MGPLSIGTLPPLAANGLIVGVDATRARASSRLRLLKGSTDGRGVTGLAFGMTLFSPKAVASRNVNLTVESLPLRATHGLRKARVSPNSTRAASPTPTSRPKTPCTFPLAYRDQLDNPLMDFTAPIPQSTTTPA